MLIYRETSSFFEWKSVFWFALGAALSLSVTTYRAAGPSRGHAQPCAPATALESRSTTASESALGPTAPVALAPAPAVSRAIARADSGAVVGGVQADASLSEKGEAGRMEMTPPEPAPEGASIRPSSPVVDAERP